MAKMKIPQIPKDAVRGENRQSSIDRGSDTYFKTPNRKKKFRLIMNLEGLNGEGKTFLSLATSPHPIFYLNLDEGSEGIMEELDKKDIRESAIPFDADDADPSKWKDQWEWAREAILEAYSHGKGTLVVDRTDQLWGLCRCGRTGDLKPDMWSYGPLNQEFGSLLRGVYRTEMNAIFIHKIKPKYIEKLDEKGRKQIVKSDELERVGFSDIDDLVQMNLRIGREIKYDKKGKPFSVRWVEVKKCRQNDSLVGTEIDDPTFPLIAMQVFPDSKLSDWK